jgi:hypothetical protein
MAVRSRAVGAMIAGAPGQCIHGRVLERDRRVRAFCPDCCPAEVPYAPVSYDGGRTAGAPVRCPVCGLPPGGPMAAEEGARGVCLGHLACATRVAPGADVRGV